MQTVRHCSSPSLSRSTRERKADPVTPVSERHRTEGPAAPGTMDGAVLRGAAAEEQREKDFEAADAAVAAQAAAANARSQRPLSLSTISGLGEGKVTTLKSLGISSVEELATLSINPFTTPGDRPSDRRNRPCSRRS